MCSSPAGPPDRLWNAANAAPPNQSVTWANVCHISALVSQGWSLAPTTRSFTRIVSLPSLPLYPNRGQHYDVWARSHAGPAIEPSHAPLVPGRYVRGPLHDVIPWLQPHTIPFVLAAGEIPQALPLADVGRFNRWSGRDGTPSTRTGGYGPRPWKPPVWNPWHQTVQMRGSSGPVELVFEESGPPFTRRGTHVYEPTPRKGPEKKLKATPAAAIRMLVNATSEFSDAVRAIHDALPAKYRESRAWYKDGKLMKRHTSTMLQDLKNNWEHINWEDAVWNLLQNEVEDQAIGRISKQGDKLTGTIFTKRGVTQGVTTRLDKAAKESGHSPYDAVNESVDQAFKWLRGK